VCVLFMSFIHLNSFFVARVIHLNSFIAAHVRRLWVDILKAGKNRFRIS